MRSNIRRARRVRPLREAVSPVTVHLAVQADAAGSIPCTVRAAAPPADSSYTSYGKLAIRLDDRDHLVDVDTREAHALHTALKGRAPAPADLTWLDTATARVVVASVRRPRLA